MDKLGKRLKEDAERLEVEIDPQLAKRLEASLAAAERRPAPRPQRRRVRTFHVASAVTGAAAAAVVAAVLLRGPDQPQAPPAATPTYAGELPNPIPPTLRRADLTDPLQQELAHLKRDAGKIRETLERDLGVTL